MSEPEEEFEDLDSSENETSDEFDEDDFEPLQEEEFDLEDFEEI